MTEMECTNMKDENQPVNINTEGNHRFLNSLQKIYSKLEEINKSSFKSNKKVSIKPNEEEIY